MDCIGAKELIFMLIKGLYESGETVLFDSLNENEEAEKEKKSGEAALKTAVLRGWAESSELVNPEKPLERRHIAAILHRFTRREMGEKDEDDICRAQVLKDLYDCHVCVNHIAQVWLKGIMESPAPDVFDMNGFMSISEAAKTVRRVFVRSERFSIPPVRNNNPKIPGELSLNEALLMAEDIKNAVIIDVRTENEYMTDHLKGAVNIPMAKLVERYGTAEGDVTGAGHYNDNGRFFKEGEEDRLKKAVCLLYCEAGYQSRVAAECLASAGFKRVYYFAMYK